MGSIASLLGGLALIIAGFVVEGAAEGLATRVGHLTLRAASFGRYRPQKLDPPASIILALLGVAVMTGVLMLSIVLYAEFARVFLHGGG